MVSVIQPFNPWAQAGQGLGQALGGIAGKAFQGRQMEKALGQLGNLADDADPIDVAKQFMLSTRYLPQQGVLAEHILPMLMQRQAAKSQLTNQPQRTLSQAIGEGPATPEDAAIRAQSLDANNDGVLSFDEGVSFKDAGMQESVRIDTAPPRFTPLSEQQRQQIYYENLQRTGRPEDAQRALESAEKSRLDSYNAKLKNYELSQSEQQARLGLEKDKENALDENLMRNYGVSTPGEIDQYTRNWAFEQFRDLRNKNPNFSDQDIWNKIQPRLKAMDENYSNLVNRSRRPGVTSTNPDVKVATDARATQDFLNTTDNTYLSRQRARTALTGQGGYTVPEAMSFTNPMNPSLKKSIEDFPKIRAVRDLPGVGRPATEKTIAQEDKYLDRMAEKIVNSWGDRDSLLLLREKLVRQKNFNEQDFERLMEKMQSMGLKKTTENINEEANLREPAIPSFIDIITGQEGVDFRRVIPRFHRL